VKQIIAEVFLPSRVSSTGALTDAICTLKTMHGWDDNREADVSNVLASATASTHRIIFRPECSPRTIALVRVVVARLRVAVTAVRVDAAAVRRNWSGKRGNHDSEDDRAAGGEHRRYVVCR
jgi:hypothetical protein